MPNERTGMSEAMTTSHVTTTTTRGRSSEPAPHAVASTASVLARLIRTIERETAAQWANEKFNDGARAAAQVLRTELGLGPADPLPEG